VYYCYQTVLCHSFKITVFDIVDIRSQPTKCMANIPNISFGKYIDTIVRLKAKEKKQGITQYIEDLADRIGLSSRQIARIRGYEGFPENDAVRKLCRDIVELQTIDSATLPNRICLPWPVCINNQNKLIAAMDNGSLTLISGWKKPLALSDERVVEAMIPALQRGFTYTFLYPSPETYPNDMGSKQKNKEEIENETERWIEELRNRLAGEWFKQLMMGRVSPSDSAKTDIEQLGDFKKLIKEKVTRDHTFSNTGFWFILPSDYVVLYNLGSEYASLDKSSPQFRHGVFRIEGQQLSIDSSESEESGLDLIESTGWLYLNKKTYLEIDRSYQNFLARKLKERSTIVSPQTRSGKRTK
jgi:transcriptional regulator with XRE-family HTH domain